MENTFPQYIGPKYEFMNHIELDVSTLPDIKYNQLPGNHIELDMQHTELIGVWK